MNFTTKGGLEEFYNRIIAEQDMPTLYTYFEQIVQSSYGIKSLDGKSFEKDPEQTKRFVQCPAYDKLMMELVGSSDAAAAFCNRCSGCCRSRKSSGRRSSYSSELR